jgi:hypothetical protein
MEEVMDFDLWLESQKNLRPKYYLIYNDGGTITGVYPESAAVEISNKIELSEELQSQLNSGETKISSYKVDILTKQLVILETVEFFPSLIRASDMIYRENKNYDVYITYNRIESVAIVELSENLGGTKQDQTKRRLLDIRPELIMRLYFTDYNDPNILHDRLEIKVCDLLGNRISKEIAHLPERFGIFTKPLFNRYGFEINENQ